MPETVLVVDDEDVVREVLADMLQDAGFAAVAARNGAEALEVLAAHRVDLVLSDISMPVLDGYAFYQQLRARPDGADLPFIFLTAHGERPRQRHAKELGVDDYLVKPVGSEDLVLAVRALLARHARLRAAQDARIDEVKTAILLAVGHELRTPLTYLSGYAQLLEGTPDVTRLRQAVDGILKGARRLERLAEDLVFLVELRSGEAFRRYEAGKRRIPLPRLLEEALAARQVSAEAGRVMLRLDLASELPHVVAHPGLLSAALDRLLDNAIKFSKPEGGTVVLRARAAADAVVLEVEDDGLGIPAGELARVAELFHQVDRHRHEQQGVGSGLTIARTVALLHGGELTASSQPDQGSTFTLRLPAAPA